MTEGRQPFTAEIKTLAKGPSTYDPLENTIGANRTGGVDMKADIEDRGREHCGRAGGGSPTLRGTAGGDEVRKIQKRAAFGGPLC